MKLSRKNFLKGSMALAATSVVVSACGDDEDDTGSGGSGGTASTSSSSDSSSSSSDSSSSSSSSTSSGMGGMGGGGGNLTCMSSNTGHSHTLSIPSADVTEGTEKTYMSGGTHSNNPHAVTVTAQDFMDLANGMMVTIDTTDAGHPHTWTLSCA